MAKRMASQPPGKPLSVLEITKRAEDFEYNPHVPLRYWLRTADTLLKEAQIYEREGNDQQAYLLLFRHAKLVLEDLSNHPDGAKPENRATLEATKKALPKALAKLELLKPRIVQRCEDYEKQSKEREERRAAAMQAKSLQGTRPRYTGRRSSTRRESDPVLAGDAKPLAASENKDLAVKIAHGEIKRRETARRAIRQAGVSADEEHERRIAGLWGDWEEEFVRDGGFSGEDDLQRRMKETRLSMKSDVSLRSKFSTRKLPSQATLDYRYPSILKREEPSYEPGVPPPFAQSISLQTPAKDIPIPRSPPSPPPKSWDHAEASLSGELQEVVPPRPAKAPLASSAAPVPPARPSSDGNTSGDLQPSSFVFKPSAFLENGTPLRTIFLPPDLRSAFLSIAAANTKANLETCGILCGTLISNALFISRLVIPEQKSTSDTCETVNESALFDYCDAEDLMVLGWIHTHPTQRCFMSSRDLHTHCGYQVMMPENIAIVCAPNQTPSWGIFRLTDPPGMKEILNCHQTGLFHLHDAGQLYTDALRPGHVFEARGLEFQVVDLRPGHDRDGKGG